MSTVVVTDSTATLPAELAASLGVTVVPLQVVVGDEVHDEGTPSAAPAAVAAALRSGRSVSTSRPSPAVLLDVYEGLAGSGATSIVSVHLSAEMSGTYESAQLAARDCSIPVVPVDSRQVGFATGYAVLAAARAASEGAEAAAEAAAACAAACTSLFYVDTLEYLRRGGRIGTATALLGGALAVKPLLTIADGHVESLERVRTAARAIARLEELAVAAAGDRVAVTVGHLDNPERAEALAETLSARLSDALVAPVACLEIGGVLGAHVGPGMLAVCVAPGP